ncbi:MAG: type III-B CRISPR-associated protein Cas10/Cmr2 [Sulfuritalea sp.]|nr:type III-B CRISPR-associated protein Cas10/Cmr2 [Sulfuritalea sp.]
MSTQNLWLAKLAAWTHDPAEKALVLMRDPAGHEGGTVRALREIFFPGGMPAEIKHAIKQGDHWAAAADRPQFGGGGREPWAQVRFDQHPVLIHPLSGEEFDLGKLADIDPAHIKALSGIHFDELIVSDNGIIDTKKTALNFWRFGPELDQSTLPLLWQLLPADTRMPDHTIWAHLDLTSAFAAAFVSDENKDAALLSMSFGPVQDFIAQSRSTSDLWAGSHLLARIAWEGLKVIAEEIGPDAVIFPQLRGVPQVDLWLRDEIGLPAERFAATEWATEKTDANPLFMAALPNKFVAIVPAGRAADLAEKITAAVRGWVNSNAQAMLAELLEKAGFANDPTLPCHAQLAQQLAGFPEVHWAAVPFALIARDDKGKAVPKQADLAAASRPFLGNIDKPGFLGTPTWQLLSNELVVDGQTGFMPKPDDAYGHGAAFWIIDGAALFTPNPGVLYPAIYDLLDRVAAAAKAARPFAAQASEGFRCDLTSDAEWLTTDRAHLALPKGQRKETLWAKAAEQFPGLLKKGEHLSAIALLKRMWPRRFTQELRGLLDEDVNRYVVSTHTLALAGSLERWIDADAGRADLLPEAQTVTALPRRLMKKLSGKSAATKRLARCLPAWLDAADDEERASRRLASADFLGEKPEAYYAFILMDGDRMGAWLSGTEADYQLTYRDTWHPKIRHSVDKKFSALNDYLNAKRAVSPAHHMAISAALNDFALHLARHVVEDLCKGKLIYAGGDDVLAMVSVDDLMRCLLLLRLAYSGIWPEQGDALTDLLGLRNERGMARLRRGHALHDGRLLRLMGEKATASAGAVVAHHQTPLSRVLRELRATENRAKTEYKGKRDAFSINLLKRSGGAVHLTLPWLAPGTDDWKTALKGDLTDSPAALLMRLRDSFAGNTSRRAAYITQGWLADLPTTAQIGTETLRDLLTANLAHQLQRQGGNAAAALGRPLTTLACALGQRDEKHPTETIRATLAVAEFLAREGRAGNPAGNPGDRA